MQKSTKLLAGAATALAAALSASGQTVTVTNSHGTATYNAPRAGETLDTLSMQPSSAPMSPPANGNGATVHGLTVLHPGDNAVITSSGDGPEVFPVQVPLDSGSAAPAGGSTAPTQPQAAPLTVTHSGKQLPVLDPNKPIYQRPNENTLQVVKYINGVPCDANGKPINIHTYRQVQLPPAPVKITEVKQPVSSATFAPQTVTREVTHEVIREVNRYHPPSLIGLARLNSAVVAKGANPGSHWRSLVKGFTLGAALIPFAAPCPWLIAGAAGAVLQWPRKTNDLNKDQLKIIEEYQGHLPSYSKEQLTLAFAEISNVYVTEDAEIKADRKAGRLVSEQDATERYAQRLYGLMTKDTNVDRTIDNRIPDIRQVVYDVVFWQDNNWVPGGVERLRSEKFDPTLVYEVPGVGPQSSLKITEKALDVLNGKADALTASVNGLAVNFDRTGVANIAMNALGGRVAAGFNAQPMTPAQAAKAAVNNILAFPA